MAIDWIDLVFKIGSAGGLFSLVEKTVKFCRQPRLQITFDKNLDLRIYTFTRINWTRKFATLHIKNKSKETAKRCVATLEIIKNPGGCGHLDKSYAIHWADVPYSQLTTGAEPVDIGSEPRRLDIVFTHQGQQISGCWISVPMALSGNIVRNQFYLPPGDYEIKIRVQCENGRGDKGEFKVISPTIWDRLDFDQKK